LESSEPWHAICQKCKDDIARLSKPLANLKKKTYQIDDEYELIFHKFGASLYRHLENGEIEYKNVKKNMKIDIVKLKNKEYTFNDLIEIKNDYLGKYEEEDMYLKSGKFGPYVQWGDKRQSIKSIKKELNEITLSDIVNLMDEIKNPPSPSDKPRAPPQIANKNILRVDYVIGFAMLLNLRNIKLKEIFDKKFFLFLEEIDLCRRIKKFNEQIFIIKKSKIFHNARKASGNSFTIG
jgi:hypothetical protein